MQKKDDQMVTYVATTAVEYQAAPRILKQSEVAPLMQKLASKFRGIVRNLGMPQAAYEDIFQQTALHVLQSIQRGTTPIRRETAVPYVKKIFVNVCRGYAGKEEKRKRYESEEKDGEWLEESFAAPQKTPLEEVIEEEERQQVRACIYGATQDLKEKDKQVINMRYLQGIQNGAIAEKLEMPYDMVKMRIFRAKEKLRKVLEKKYGKHRETHFL